ncbi:MAG: hypothetical protein H6644_11500 [Caldilineaceae bacterium]|nr:hypothetical protein [Caldilineaceae bacterium]
MTPHFLTAFLLLHWRRFNTPDYIQHCHAAAGIKEQERHAVQERVMDFFAGKSVLLPAGQPLSTCLLLRSR